MAGRARTQREPAQHRSGVRPEVCTSHVRGTGRLSCGGIRKLAVPCLAFTCASALAIAGARPQRSQRIPETTMRTSTGLVLVDVVVTGKDGKPVQGLNAGDFRVLESGKAQEIAVFQAQRAPSATGPAVAPAPLPPDTFTNLPAYHPASGPLTVVLLDSLNTPIFSQSRMRMALIRYLAKLLKQDRPAAILSLTDRLKVLQDFTASRRLLLAAVKGFKPRESDQMAVREEMTSRAKDNEYLNVLRMAKACEKCLALIEFYKSLKAIDRHILTTNDEDRAQLTAVALEDIANALEGYPGRKNLIWLSESFPSLYEGGPGMKLAWSAESELHRAANLLNDARVAVYPVDARGLTTNATPGPDEVGWQEIAQGAQYESSPDNYLDWQRQARSPMYNLFKSQETMRSVAAATGGVAFYNSNDITHAVATAAADSSDSYLIGYYPTDRDWNGRYRRISVEVTQKGLQLRYREGYYALPGFSAKETKSEKAPQQQLQAALLDPLPPTGVLFNVQVPPPAPASQSVVSGKILLPPGSVTLDSTCGVNLSFRVAALTPAGKIAAERGSNVRRQFSSQQCPELRQGNLVFTFELPLKPGRYQVEFLTRDNRTGAVGRVDVPVQIAAR